MEGKQEPAYVQTVTGIDSYALYAGYRKLCRLKEMECWQHQCQCADCKTKPGHSNQRVHRLLNILLGHLNEQQRRWLVGMESLRIGHGGDRKMALITGMNVETIRRGRREMQADLVDCPPGRVRRHGAGRPSRKKNCGQQSSTLNTDRIS
jgi:hypothetical protein